MPTPQERNEQRLIAWEQLQKMPAAKAFLAEIHAAFGKPAWFRLTEDGVTVEFGEKAPW